MATPPPPDFAAVLRQELENRDISQQEFAGMVGVSENSVSSWITGKFRPSHERSEEIAAALGMTLDQLHGRTAPPPPAAPAAAPPPSATATPDEEARRIVQQLAALQIDQPIERLRDVTPDLLQVLADARAHAAQGNGAGR
jgi:transcriptional regulator with XRE-family HTH domain